MSKEYFLQGNEAYAKGALKAGCKFFAGYPITPSTEVAEDMARELPKNGGVFIQMEDEIGSLGAVIGAAWGGSKAMTATSGPGFSLMQEGLGYAAITETPLVIINVQRGSPSTGQPTMASQSDVMQARWGSHGDYEIIALSPSSVQECFDFTVKAFNLSEKYRVPVIVLGDEIVAHMREKIVIPDEVEIISRKMPEESPEDFLLYKADENSTPNMPVFAGGYNVHVTGLTHDDRGYPDTNNPKEHAKLVTRLCNKIIKNREDITSVNKYECDDAEIVLISYGAPSRSAITAVKKAREEGIKAGFLKLNTIWPFPDKEVKEVAKTADKLIMVEMNLGQLVNEVKRVAEGDAKVSLMGKIGGEIHKPFEILSFIKEIQGGK